MTRGRILLAVGCISAATLFAGPLDAQSVPTPGSRVSPPGSTTVPTPHSSATPVGADWSRPDPQTGGYFYNDPRLQQYNQPLRPRRQTTCPPGMVLNPSAGSCY